MILMERFRKLLLTRIGNIFNQADVALPLVDVYETDFSLSDTMACTYCKENDSSGNGCNREVLKVHPSSPVAVFPIDKWLKLLPSKELERFKICDYFFIDATDEYASKKVGFCDITCSEVKYVNPGSSTKYPAGKRAYMLKQMESVAEWILSDPVLYSDVATATNRRLVFGIRYSKNKPQTKASKSMSAFSKTPSSTAGSLASIQNIKGFVFNMVETVYPNIFMW